MTTGNQADGRGLAGDDVSARGERGRSDDPDRDGLVPDAGAVTRVLDWAFRSRETGRIVIGRPPNLTISLFLAAWAVTWFADPAGTLGTSAKIAANAFLGV